MFEVAGWIMACVFLVFGLWAQRAAYRNGVVDGYCNPWLPHVRRQIKSYRLVQARKEDDCP